MFRGWDSSGSLSSLTSRSNSGGGNGTDRRGMPELQRARSAHVSPEQLATVEDSPMLRRSLQAYLSDVEESRDAVATFLKSADAATRVGLEYAESLKVLAESCSVTGARLNSVWNHENSVSPGSHTASTPPWLDVARALSLYGASLTEQSAMVRQHMAQLSSSWQALQPVASARAPAAIAALRQRFDTASSEHRAAVEAHLALQRARAPAAQLGEAAGRAERATWVLEQCRFNYVTALNRAESQMHVQLMESVTAAFASHLESAERGLCELSEMRTEMAPIAGAARAARLGWGEDEQRMNTQRIEQMDAAAADGEWGGERSSRLLLESSTPPQSSTRFERAASPPGCGGGGGGARRVAPRRRRSSAARAATALGRCNAQQGVVTEFQGYLHKQSSSVRADWKRRFFFITRGGELFYCRSEEDVDSPKAVGSLLLISAKEIATGVAGDAYTFVITSPLRRHTLQAESARGMHAWLGAMQNATSALLTMQQLARSTTSPMCPYSDGGVPVQSLQTLQTLLAIPGNEVCAECAEARPDWCSLVCMHMHRSHAHAHAHTRARARARTCMYCIHRCSLNLGVLLCLQCSGIHRSLGTRPNHMRHARARMHAPRA